MSAAARAKAKKELEEAIDAKLAVMAGQKDETEKVETFNKVGEKLDLDRKALKHNKRIVRRKQPFVNFRKVPKTIKLGGDRS